MYNPVVFSLFTRLCSQYHYLIQNQTFSFDWTVFILSSYITALIKKKCSACFCCSSWRLRSTRKMFSGKYILEYEECSQHVIEYTNPFEKMILLAKWRPDLSWFAKFVTVVLLVMSLFHGRQPQWGKACPSHRAALEGQDQETVREYGL